MVFKWFFNGLAIFKWFFNGFKWFFNGFLNDFLNGLFGPLIVASRTSIFLQNVTSIQPITGLSKFAIK